MRQTATGIAIAGFVIGLIAVFVPIVGIYVSALALGLCTIAAYLGERPLTIATVALTAMKTFFLSPFFHALASENTVLVYAAVLAALGAPIIAMVAGNASREQASEPGNKTGMPGR